MTAKKKTTRKKATRKKVAAKRKMPKTVAKAVREVGGLKAIQKQHDENGKFAKGNTTGHRFKAGAPSENSLGRPPYTRQLSKGLALLLDKPASTLTVFKDLAKAYGLNSNKATIQDVLLADHIHHVLDGKSEYMKELFNRIEGKVVDKVVLATEKNTTDAIKNFMAARFDEEAKGESHEDND